jgi:hypothetical protein
MVPPTTLLTDTRAKVAAEADWKTPMAVALALAELVAFEKATAFATAEISPELFTAAMAATVALTFCETPTADALAVKRSVAVDAAALATAMMLAPKPLFTKAAATLPPVAD